MTSLTYNIIPFNSETSEGKKEWRTVQQEFEISRQAALKEMNKLVGLKVVSLKGKGREAYYELA